ncbi:MULTISPECIES: UDP-N-acetylmuramoyl-tripeptide--D-alanyl-D-alanine ligase [Sphingomonas]|uniref:UDP-N-acetylmuramoyl-tripeptide--D-alanyl-D- alanine ligase n=1 Tax=Sphingomonas TaxID=13687 RepID=UPI0004DB6592|nr:MULTISPECIES: UDP-N-acetylmuramoyl-tripeptide--D-alanyl-D-alanine ligase [Sphingomonas]KQM99663.1 UDP-N-acetylmuramoylalanyl-D-glutamyl-2, 6-diaminopimelate--D-alanyl-D-alanine ligase [Sphingomonas sp. Leaf226]MDY0965939.1 UDP-N-acetylmuramoyl-tripeptide--D-alanyl-D-alanine ligase [Sphingomonas sp. CFBP9021]USQ99639.1 UDP-N-acetylmuramoyl-tripeptide--D-alanyl-D-alanine ligase [Sphingomonas aerolata]
MSTAVPLWTSAEIAAATGGVASAEFAVTGVAFDSREVGPGDLFVAMKGEASDGHLYLDQAFAQGAAGAIVSEPCAHPHVLVADSFTALQMLGRASRARSGATIIGVTGSVGKTSAKEALFAALDRGAPGAVHRSVKSYNNHTGVPLSLARMPRDARFGVFEMGMNHAGELAELTQIVRPHIAVVTAIAPAHTEFFRDESAIADAKGEIFAGLEPDGVAIVPFDSPHRDRLAAAATPHAARIVTFGIAKGADVRAIETVRLATGATFVTVQQDGRELSFTMAQPGMHWVSNALAVVACVEAAGADLGLAGLALAELGGLQGRGARFMTTLADGQALVIDESYNANPASMRATLAVLAKEPGRHVALLGEMRELGEASADYHAGLAEPIVAANVEMALLVGEAMAPLAQALEGKVETVHVGDAVAALTSLRTILAPGDAVLIKGSNGVGLARVVTSLGGGKT